jgi:hypothetical protein
VNELRPPAGVVANLLAALKEEFDGNSGGADQGKNGCGGFGGVYAASLGVRGGWKGDQNEGGERKLELHHFFLVVGADPNYGSVATPS